MNTYERGITSSDFNVARGGDTEVVIDDPIRAYLKESENYPLLSREQEGILGSTIQAGRVAEAVRALARGFVSIPPSGIVKESVVRQVLSSFRLSGSVAVVYGEEEPIGLQLINETHMPWEDRTVTNLALLVTSVEDIPKKREGFLEIDTKLAKLMEDGARAREIFINSNMLLVVDIANNFKNRGLELEDLISEGNLGLMRAIDDFDPGMGNKFSTYATQWIQQRIRYAIREKGRQIRVPAHMGEEIDKLGNARQKLTNRFGRSPSDQELSEELGIPEKRVKKLQGFESQGKVGSLNKKIGEDDDSEIGDLTPDNNQRLPDDVVIEEDRKKMVWRMISGLDGRERRIIMLRFGLVEDGRERTLEEIGEELGVTRERIRQLQKRALNKLRRKMAGRDKEDYL